MKTYRIFLASSAELIADRKEFEIALARLNDEYARQHKHVHLDLYIWERESEAVFDTRKQDQYNQNLDTCDLFVLLFWTKVGKYTNEEFDTALHRFRETKKPLLFTYQKTALPSHAVSDADQQSRAEFDNKLLNNALHFTGRYEHAVELTGGFRTELDKLFASGDLEYGVKAECLHDAGKASVPPTFVGRDVELLDIRQRLNEGGRLMLINSEGGMGKTTIAARYWDENLHQYRYNAWLFCEKGIVEEIKSLAPALGIDLSKLPDDAQQVEAIRKALNNLAREDDCLLVLDNANNPDHIRAFQQQFGGLNWHILITSRCSAVIENEYPIRHLPPDVAKKLFMDLYPLETGDEFEQLLDQFLRAVGYNTLAIEIFAKNLNKAAVYHREKLADLIGRLDEKGLLLGKNSFKVKTGYLDAVHKSKPNEDANTDQIIEALYDLTQLTEAERFWLVNFSLLPAVSHEAYLLGQLFDTDTAELCEEHLEPLAQKGWLTTATQTYRLSPVVQKIALAKNKETLWEDGKTVVERLNYLLEIEGDFTVNLTLTQAHPFVEIGKAVADSLPGISWNRSALYFNVGVCFRSLGLFAQAINCFQKSGDVSQERGDQESTTLVYSRLGDLYQALGKFDEALTYFEKDLKLTDELYQSNPDSESLKNGMAISYEKLGDIYQAQGQFEQALIYFEKETALFDELYQSNPRSESLKNGLAIAYSKLGTLYQAQEQLEQALTYFEKATALFNELYQSNPRSESLKNGLAIAYSKLGAIYQAQGQFEQALTYFEKRTKLANELYQSNPRSVALLFGVATSYIWVGYTNQQMNNESQALPYYQKALPLLESLVNAVPIPQYQKQLAWVRNAIKRLSST